MIPQFVGKSMPLSESGLTNVCSQLGTDAAAIWAVLHVEKRQMWISGGSSACSWSKFHLHRHSGSTIAVNESKAEAELTPSCEVAFRKGVRQIYGERLV